MKNGNKILVTQLVAGCASDFYFHAVGKVSSSKEWPFTGGSGLNSEWNGHEVVRAEYYIAGTSTGQYITADGEDAVTEPYGAAGQFLVEDYVPGYGYQYKLINVKVSDNDSATRYLTAHLADGNQAYFGSSGIAWDIF